MVYIFRYRTGYTPDITEGEYTVDSSDLISAVLEFKHFVRANFTSLPVVVSFFYLIKDSDKIFFLHEFTDSFYKKHFGDFLK